MSEDEKKEKKPRQQLAEWLDGQEFYEHMQTYRHASLISQTEVVNTFERVKNLLRQKVKEFYEPDLHEDYMTVYQSIGGWKAVHVTWSKDGYWEPEQTGVGAYLTEAEAVVEAKSWAADEGLEFKGREPKRN